MIAVFRQRQRIKDNSVEKTCKYESDLLGALTGAARMGIFKQINKINGYLLYK
jgi:hypothetical protein